MRLTAILLLITSLAFGQDMVIDFTALKNKQVKSNAAVLISDHTIDGRLLVKPGYWIEFVGASTRGIVLKNFIGTADNPVKFTLRNVTNKRTDKGVTIKVGDYMQNFIIDGTNTTSIKALAGGSADQIIYLEGKFLLNPTIQNFPDIDGGRPRDMKTTVGGAALQIKGWNTADCNGSNWNIGNVTIDNVHITNANDEIFYLLHNTTIGNYTRGKILRVRNSSGRGAGRDGGQAIAFDSVIFINCVFDDLGREMESNHISGFSLNAGNKNILIENCRVTNSPQFIYSGTEGVEGNATIKNSYFDQGSAQFIDPKTGKLTSGNQALYLKADKNPNFIYTLIDNTIIAPKVLRSAIAVDNATLRYSGNNISAPVEFYRAGGTVQLIELPVIKNYFISIQVQETTIGGQTTIKYFLPSGVELKP